MVEMREQGMGWTRKICFRRTVNGTGDGTRRAGMMCYVGACWSRCFVLRESD